MGIEVPSKMDLHNKISNVKLLEIRDESVFGKLI